MQKGGADASAVKTPGGSNSGGPPSWLADLDAYVSTHPVAAAGGGEHGSSNSERHGLVAAVQALPQSAEAWRALLAFEEAHSSNLTQQQAAGAAADPARVSLYHLYYYATQLVPRNKNQHKEAYLQLWLGFARQQWSRSPDDARDTFKTLKNQHIGDASAHLYYEWALLEHSGGNISKALGIIAKGMRADAQPASLLQQLQGELQSGTFDLKAAGAAVTETLTLDAGALAGPHALSTPAASAGMGLRAGLTHTGNNPSTARAPASVLTASAAASAAAHPRGIASCLKTPAATLAAAGAAGSASVVHQEQPTTHHHHAARAVTFAADVHDAGGSELGAAAAAHPHRAGSVSACSQHSAGHGVEGHSGCLSNVSSSPSRSMVSVHDGTMPFSSGAVSYKSSTTESSTVSGLEEATISCGVSTAAGGAPHATGGKGSSGDKPSTAPLVGASSSTTPAAGGNANTATLGLKRFGFKSRALRVGGAADTPAAAAALGAAGAEPAAAGPANNAAAAPAAAGSLHPRAAAVAPPAAAAPPPDADGSMADDDAALGCKRRAAAGSVLSPSVSPKLAAAVRHGQQCKVQPAELVSAAAAAAARDVGAGDAIRSLPVPAAQGGVGGRQQGGAGSSIMTAPQSAAVGAGDASTTDEDSVPLVGSKLAARVSHDRGTPLAAGRGREAVAQDMGLWSSPVDGQLPSSLETTPSDVLPAGGAAAGAGAGSNSTGSRHAGKPKQQQQHQPCEHVQQPHSRQQESLARPQQQQQQAERQHAQQARNQQPVAAVPPHNAAGAREADRDATPPPTMVLPDVSAVPCSREGGQPQGAQTSSGYRTAAHSSDGGAASSMAAPQQQQQVPAMREPLRPLQTSSHPPPVGGTQPGSAASKAQPTAYDKPAVVVQPQAAAHKQQQQQAHVERRQQQQQQHHQPQQQQQQKQQQPVQQQQVQQRQQVQVQAPSQQQPQPQQQPPAAVRQVRPKEDPQTVFVQGVRYHKLECVGRGGSSKVFKVMGPGCKIYALKRIKLAGRDEEAASGFIDEINLLNCLRNKPNIIQLVDSQVFTSEGLIYMVQEYGEIDLARLLAKHDAARKEACAQQQSQLKDNIDENFIRLYWQQMLQAVAGVHEQRIVHSDLKPANFLLVEGQLKLIDFGIAKAICGDTTSIARESQVGTLNYMSPEAILGGTNNILGGPAMKVGRPSDIWSLGCILYQMVYGRTPFADLPFVPKMHAICNPHHVVSYPDLSNKDLLDVMRRCLDRDPKTRITLQELLDHPFLHPARSVHQAHQQVGAGGAPSGPVGLSEEQMKLLVAQVAAAGAAGLTDLDKLTRELMQKLGATTLNSSSSGSSTPADTDSSGGGTTAAAAQAANARHAAAADHHARQQRAQGTGGLTGGGVSTSSRPRTASAAAPPASQQQPGWR